MKLKDYIIIGALLPTLVGAFITLDLFWGFRDEVHRVLWITVTAPGALIGWLAGDTINDTLRDKAKKEKESITRPPPPRPTRSPE